METGTGLETNLGAVARIKNFEVDVVLEGKPGDEAEPDEMWPEYGSFEFRNVLLLIDMKASNALNRLGTDLHTDRTPQPSTTSTSLYLPVRSSESAAEQEAENHLSCSHFSVSWTPIAEVSSSVASFFPPYPAKQLASASSLFHKILSFFLSLYA